MQGCGCSTTSLASTGKDRASWPAASSRSSAPPCPLGFDYYADYTTGERAQLCAQFPAHAEMITALTR